MLKKVNQRKFFGLVLLSFVAIWAEDVTYVLAAPRISEGTIYNDVYFDGPIKLQTTYSDPNFGMGKTGSYSINGGAAWNSATVLSGLTTPGALVGPAQIPLSLLGTLKLSDGSFATFHKIGGTDGTFYTRYDALGNKLVDTKRLDFPKCDHSSGIFTPEVGQRQVIALPNGGFLAWANVGGGCAFRVSNDGDTLGSPIFTFFGWQALKTLTDGKILALTTTSEGVQGVFLDFSGQKISDYFPIDSTLLGGDYGNFSDSWNASILPLPNGEFLLIGNAAGWKTNNPVRAQRYDAFGHPTGNKFPINPASPAAPANYNSAALLKDGSFVITWMRVATVSDPNMTIMAQVFYPNGLPRGNPITVSTFEGNPYIEPQVGGSSYWSMFAYATTSPLGDGGFSITWTKYSILMMPPGVPNPKPTSNCISGDSTGGTGIYHCIFSRMYNISGQPVSALFSLGNLGDLPSYENQPPHVESLDEGGIMVFSGRKWTGIGDPTVSAIFERKIYQNSIILSPKISPATDIDVVFRLTDTTNQSNWLSPHALYKYGNPSWGSGGTASYQGGYTNAESIAVGINKPANPAGYQTVQLLQNVSLLEQGNCTAFTGWAAQGTQSTLDNYYMADLEDGKCYQFKWVVTTNLAKTFEYMGSGTVKVDRLSPLVSVSSEVSGSTLLATISTVESVSTIASRTYSLNGGAAISFSGDLLQIPLVDGSNVIKIMVQDEAGNSGFTQFFQALDIIPPRIDIVSIMDAATYGSDLSLNYVTTQPLSQIVVTVDGQAVTDLSTVANGAHQLTVSGVDANNNVVTQSVNFIKDTGALSATILSPQAREYPTDSLTVAYTLGSGASLSEMTLDGSPVSSPELTSLSNGNHNLSLTITDGTQTQTLSRDFSVKKVVPTLNVSSPVSGKIYTNNEIVIEFDSNNPVYLTVEDTYYGRINSGYSLVLNSDGLHKVLLTSTSTFGNKVSRTVNFETDSKPLSITVASPKSQVYALADILVDFTANKAVQSVETKLDGVPVTHLNNLTNGEHVFEITAKDRSGRAATRTVNFTMAQLAIVFPIDGAQIVDNRVPPIIDLQYTSSGLSNLTATVNSGTPQLLPGTSGTYGLQTRGGWQTLVLKGSLNNFQLAKRVDFKEGMKNVVANSSSIQYAYSNCSSDLICDVSVILKIFNSGDFDISQPIPVHFEVSGTPQFAATYDWTIANLAAKQVASRTLSSFKAKLGDIFKITLDADQQIPGEQTTDNIFQVSFEPGKILDVLYSLSDENFYLSDVTANNVFATATAGNVAFVEYDANGVFFRTHGSDQTFSSPVDMGFLTPEKNFVIISAYDADSRLLDRTIRFFDVRRMSDKLPRKKNNSPWLTLMSAGGRILIDSLDQKTTVTKEVESLTAATKMPVMISSNETSFDAVNRRKVNYMILSNDGLMLTQKSFQIPDAGGLSQTVLNEGSCEVLGVMPEYNVGTSTTVPSAWVDMANQKIDKLLAVQNQALNDTLASAFVGLNQALNDTLSKNGLNLGFNSKGTIVSAGVPGAPDSAAAAAGAQFVINLDIDIPKVSVNFNINPDVSVSVAMGNHSCSSFTSGSDVMINSTVKYTSNISFSGNFGGSAVLGDHTSAQAYGIGGAVGSISGTPVFAEVGIGYARIDIDRVYPLNIGFNTSLDAGYSGGIKSDTSMNDDSVSVSSKYARISTNIPGQTQRVTDFSGSVNTADLILGLNIGRAWGAAYLTVKGLFALRSDMTSPVSVNYDNFTSGQLPNWGAAVATSGRTTMYSRGDIYVDYLICGWNFFIGIYCWHDTYHKDFTIVDECKTIGDANVEGSCS